MGLTKVTYSMIEGASANVLDYGADNLGLSDSTSAIQAAIDYINLAGGGNVVIPAGTYKTTATIYMKSNVAIICDNNVLIDATSFTDSVVAFDGSIGSEYALSVAATVGDTTFTTASASGLSVGDIVHFVAVTNAASRVDAGAYWLGSGTSDGSGGDTNVYFAEWNIVAEALGGNQFRLAKAFIFPGYNTTNAGLVDTNRTTSAVQKVTPITNAHWIGGVIDRTNVANDCFDSLWAYDCSVSNATIQRGQQSGEAVRWVSSWKCEGRNLTCINDPSIVWNYNTYHGKLNRFKVIGCEDCGFDSIRDSYSAQSVDFTYFNNQFCNIRPYCKNGFFDNCFEGVTSHNGSFQERWINNVINIPNENLSIGILCRGYEPTIIDNVITTPVSVTDNVGVPVTYGIALFYGGPRRSFVSNNVIRGFYGAITIASSETLDWKIQNALIDVSNNEISDSLYGLYTVLALGSNNNSVRYISYRNNRHTRMGQFMAYLDEYSAGVSIKDNLVMGAFAYTGTSIDVGVVFSKGNSPMLQITGNQWLRPKGSNPGLTNYLAFIDSITDTTVYPKDNWAAQSIIDDNYVSFADVDSAGSSAVSTASYIQLAYNLQNQYYQIASGSVAIVPTKNRVTTIMVDTESSAASDNLDSIVPYTNSVFQVGDILIIKTFVSSRDVVIRDVGTSGVSSNGFVTAGGASMNLSVSSDVVTCVYNGTNWFVTSRAL